MKLLKKNQVIIYTIAVLLMVAGYLNYSTNTGEALEASANEVANTANIGDARLVSTNPVTENATNEVQNTSNVTNTANTNTTTENTVNNTTTQTSTTVSTDDYFAKSKLERDTMYSQMLETYENVLNSDNSLETQTQSATEEITKINAPYRHSFIERNDLFIGYSLHLFRAPAKSHSREFLQVVLFHIIPNHFIPVKAVEPFNYVVRI